jgi:hypothetical protein
MPNNKGEGQMLLPSLLERGWGEVRIGNAAGNYRMFKILSSRFFRISS